MTAIEFNYQLTSLQGSLERFAYSLTSNFEDARDLLQETFVKAISYRDKFADDTNLKAWTFTIMKNTFINNYRRRQRNKTINENNGLFLMIHQTKSDGAFNPDSIFESKEIEKIIESIDDKLRIPFKMKHEGYKYKEIAEILDLKLGTVKSRIFFARQKLMKQLKENVNVRYVK